MEYFFAASDIVVIFFVIIVSVGLHEAAHAFTAHVLGDNTPSDHGLLTFNPLKHVDIITAVLLPVIMILFGVPPIFVSKPVPMHHQLKFEEFGTAIVALMGPAMNLLIAILAAVILRAVGPNAPVIIVNTLLISVMVNIGFFVFNMIPFPPLDGSRILFAFAPEPLQRAIEALESYGFLVFLAFFFLLYRFVEPMTSFVSEYFFRILL